MKHMQRIVNVSNRLPFPGANSAPGGLASGVLAAMHAQRGLWLGWDGDLHPADPERLAITSQNDIAFARISLPGRLRDLYYNGFANGALWPLLHSFLDRFRYRAEEQRAYQAVNEIFAQRLQPLLGADDLIWVHDYHLFPLARCLRARGIRAPIGFFLHVPFPSYETLRALPTFADLIDALLSYDLVGFQTSADRHAFVAAVEQLHGRGAVQADRSIVIEGRQVLTDVFPIGVDSEAIARSAELGARSEFVTRTGAGLGSRKLILGVDRLDYSKGILERFEAYRDFLDRYPSNIGNVTYLQIAPLGRLDVEPYARMREALEQSVGRTNARYACADWTPIRYLNRDFEHQVLMGFMRSAHACLVTSLRDGMNLVAKEYVCAQDPADPGVLVLSDRTGSACELTDALIVNPYDSSAVADAIQAAIDMPLTQRRARHERLLCAVRRNDIHAWRSRFLELLAKASSQRGKVPNTEADRVNLARNHPRSPRATVEEWPRPTLQPRRAPRSSLTSTSRG